MGLGLFLCAVALIATVLTFALAALTTPATVLLYGPVLWPLILVVSSVVASRLLTRDHPHKR